MAYSDGLTVPMSTSIGVGYLPNPNATREALFAAADTDMYRAKRSAPVV